MLQQNQVQCHISLHSRYAKIVLSPTWSFDLLALTVVRIGMRFNFRVKERGKNVAIEFLIVQISEENESKQNVFFEM